MLNKDEIIIFDFEHKSLVNVDCTSICWDDIYEENDTISLLKYIENNGEYYKRKYINYINRLSSFKIRGHCLHDYFIINKNFSFWQMSLIEEKVFIKLPL